MKSALIIGAGSFGLCLAKMLTETGCAVDLMDKDATTRHRSVDAGCRFLCNNAWNIPSMKDLSVPSYDVCYITMHAEPWLLTHIINDLRQAGAKRVIARTDSPMHQQVLLEAGADRAVVLEQLACDALICAELPANA